MTRQVGNVFRSLGRDDMFGSMFSNGRRVVLSSENLTCITDRLTGCSFLSTAMSMGNATCRAVMDGALGRRTNRFFAPEGVVGYVIRVLSPSRGYHILSPTYNSNKFLIVILSRMERGVTEEVCNSLSSLRLRTGLGSPRISSYMHRCTRGVVFNFSFSPSLGGTTHVGVIVTNSNRSGVCGVGSLSCPCNTGPSVPLVTRTIGGDVGRDTSGSFGFAATRGGTRNGFSVVFAGPPFKTGIRMSVRVTGQCRLGDGTPRILFVRTYCGFLGPNNGVTVILPSNVLNGPGARRMHL